MFLEQFEFCRNLEASFLRRMGAFHLVVGEASEENRGQFRQGREVQVKVAEAIGGRPGSLRRRAGAGAAVSDGAFVVAPFMAAQGLAGGEAFVADGALADAPRSSAASIASRPSPTDDQGSSGSPDPQTETPTAAASSESSKLQVPYQSFFLSRTLREKKRERCEEKLS
nr:hypothetical protein Iba_chr15bCG4220 [Ipomoea batatas]